MHAILLPSFFTKRRFAARLLVVGSPPMPRLLNTCTRWKHAQTFFGTSTAGFCDPFDVRKDVTLDNLAYRFWGVSLMAGKLDWLLLRRLAVQRQEMGNQDYAASDHKWLSADVTFADI